MKFKIDEEIEKLDLSNVDDVVQLIIGKRSPNFGEQR
jgi:hypothetical protein